MSTEDMTYSTAAEWVVTFNRVDDFRGLRRMTKEEADKLAAYAARLNYRLARVVRITRPTGPDTCWCGAPRGPRVPHDEDGMGCLRDIHHGRDGAKRP